MEEQPEQSGEHLVERCRILAEARERVERSEMREWRTRHSRNQLKGKEKKGPVEPEREKEEDKLERFFCHLYEFHIPVPSAPVFVPAELPPRYAIEFVPATNVPVFPTSTDYSVISSVNDFSAISSANFVVSSHAPSTDYSVISSVNFVVPDPISSSSSTCIETT